MVYNILNLKDFKWDFENYESLILFYRNFSKELFSKFHVYTEVHHILPKCLGGENTKDNLIELPWMIHILAHYLLAKQLEPIDKEASVKNFYAVRMILNQDKVENIEELKKLSELRAIELEMKNILNCKRIFIKKEGEKSVQIFEDEFPKYEKMGWVKGRNFKDPSGKVFVNDGTKNYLISKEELDSYLEKGFQRGMFKTAAMLEYSHKSEITTKGWKWVFKGTKSLLIEPEKLNEYLEKGWVLGSGRAPMKGKKNPHSLETRKKLSEANKGKPKSLEHRKKLSESRKGLHWFTDGTTNISARECPEGFRKGRTL